MLGPWGGDQTSKSFTQIDVEDNVLDAFILCIVTLQSNLNILKSSVWAKKGPHGHRGTKSFKINDLTSEMIPNCVYGVVVRKVDIKVALDVVRLEIRHVALNATKSHTTSLPIADW